MNSIKILQLDQCEIIIKDLLHLSGNQSEEIYHNMWCITLEGSLIKNIKIEELKSFVEKLIKNREQQADSINCSKNILFYMWFDQQALQLRFNVLIGDETRLPFTCKLNLLNTYESILKSFVDTAQEVDQFGDDIQFLDRKDSNWDEDENEEEYILDVFVKKLNTKIYG